MDAITLLKEDHQKVKKLMGELEKTTERGVKTREELFTKLDRHRLSVHRQIDAGEKLLARLRVLREELEDLASSDSPAQDADRSSASAKAR